MAWAPDYVTTAELRSYLTRSSVTVDDTYLGMAVTAASRVVDDWCGRQFGKVDAPEARTFAAEYDASRRRWYVPIDDLHSTTGLTVNADDDDDQTYDQAITDYQLWPVNAPQKGRPWERIVVNRASTVTPYAWDHEVAVSGLFGWAAVPVAVQEATLIEAARIYMRRVSPFGIAGSPETGSELRLLRAVDVDAQKILAPYRKRWGAV